MKFISQKPIILASSSPRRKELLEKAGIDFTVRPSGIAEDLPFTRKAPHHYAMALSAQKARDVQQEDRDEIIIAADTIVVKEGVLFPKPADDQQAAEFLRELSGKTHQVITGVTVLAGGEQYDFAGLSQVKFKRLDDELIEQYVASGDARDKAGAYGIQTQGMLFVEMIAGDYQNIVGLPVAELVELLRDEELIRLDTGGE